MGRSVVISRRGMLCGCATVVVAGRAEAQGQDFYRGKTITFLVGSDPGGGYDLLARLVARHIGRFIPGRPNVVVENMPGAGSILLSNRIYNLAPKDGTVLGLVQRGVMLAAVTGQPGARFDLSQFNWIGSITAEQALVAVWATCPAQSFQDLQRMEITVGGTGPTSDAEASARLLNGVAGTKLKIVSGYPGSADVLLAMQRGEVEGTADLSWGELKARNAALLESGKLRLLAQHGLQPMPGLPDVPATLPFVHDDEGREVARLYYLLKAIARPILAAPGIPPDRVLLLRQAFAAMTIDADYKADAGQSKLDLSPCAYDMIDAFIAETKAVPAATRDHLKRVLNPGGA